MKFMSLIRSAVVALAAVVVLTGCSPQIIPPAFKGKILTTSGYNVEILEPTKLNIYGRDELVLLETGMRNVSETMSVKMKDKLTLTFDVRFRARVGGTEAVLNSMFNDIVVTRNVVTFDQVYGVYGRDVVQQVARSVVGKYDTEEVPLNFDVITQDLAIALSKAMVSSPLEVSNFTLGALEYPPTIVKAIENQSERKLAIETEANQQAIETVKRTNELALAILDRETDLAKARTLRDANLITAAGLSDVLLRNRALDVQAEMAKNNAAVFVPYEALNSSGVSNRVFAK